MLSESKTNTLKERLKMNLLITELTKPVLLFKIWPSVYWVEWLLVVVILITEMLIIYTADQAIINHKRSIKQ